MLHVGLLTVIGELISLLIVVVVADVHIYIILSIRELVAIIKISPMIHWAFCTCCNFLSAAIRAQTESFCLNWIRDILLGIEVLL